MLVVLMVGSSSRCLLTSWSRILSGAKGKVLHPSATDALTLLVVLIPVVRLIIRDYFAPA